MKEGERRGHYTTQPVKQVPLGTQWDIHRRPAATVPANTHKLTEIGPFQEVKGVFYFVLNQPMGQGDTLSKGPSCQAWGLSSESGPTWWEERSCPMTFMVTLWHAPQVHTPSLKKKIYINVVKFKQGNYLCRSRCKKKMFKSS